MVKTTVEGSVLRIPTWIATASKFQSTPTKVDNTLLSQLFTPQELEGLVLVKTPLQDATPAMLKPQNFDDGIKRKLAFSSGNNHYFAPKRLYQQIKAFFATELDGRCRYGSLLSSNCYQGLTPVKNLRVKIVDYTHPNDARWQTNDCHGKISSRLAKLIGGQPNLPFQFRLAYNRNRYPGAEAPQINFLAKGTVLVDDSLTTEQGYDLVLDVSSIKGIHKARLQSLILTGDKGDYELPRAVIGNRQNATANLYNNSWQFTICYSTEAIDKDLGPATCSELQKLLALRDNPLALRQWILDEHDRKKQEVHLVDDDEPNFDDLESHDTQDDPNLIQILRADRHGILLNAPKVQQFIHNTLRRKLADLAIKGGYKHPSGMAMPSCDLKPGQVCVPHLPAGETVIVARSPIPDKDHIRKYHNIHLPHLTQYKNTVWMNPHDAASHHQGDFDGDQMTVDLASQLPHISKETRWANDIQRDFPPVQKRPKQPYITVDPATGKSVPLSIEKVATLANQNSVGLVASWIGQVKSSEPPDEIANNPKQLETWETQKHQLLFRLKQALLVEVDYGKSAERFQDVQQIQGSTLATDVADWTEKYPVPFFKVYKNDLLYDRFALPTSGQSAINVLPDIVNQQWSETRPYRCPRHSFQSLLVDPKLLKSPRGESFKEEARAFKEQFYADCALIRDQNLTGDSVRKAYSQLYEGYREQLAKAYPTEASRSRFQQALWFVCHSDNQTRKRDVQAWANWSSQKRICFEYRQGQRALNLPNQALPFSGPVLSAPLGQGDSQDKVLKTKAWLDRKGIQYTALLENDIPYVSFALHNLKDKGIDYLENKFGLNDPPTAEETQQARKRLGLSKIAFPPSYSEWAFSQQEEGVAALAYAVLVPQLCKRLAQLQPTQIQVTGVQYNDYAKCSFKQERWRHPITLEVGRLQFNPEDWRYAKYHNRPCLKLHGKVLGVFGDNSPQFPVGTTLKARIPQRQRPNESAISLEIDPQSIQLPSTEAVVQPQQTTVALDTPQKYIAPRSRCCGLQL